MRTVSEDRRTRRPATPGNGSEVRLNVHGTARGGRRHPAAGLGLRAHDAGAVSAATELPLLRPLPQARRHTLANPPANRRAAPPNTDGRTTTSPARHEASPVAGDRTCRADVHRASMPARNRLVSAKRPSTRSSRRRGAVTGTGVAEDDYRAATRPALALTGSSRSSASADHAKSCAPMPRPSWGS
jgi:hypothetical protein